MDGCVLASVASGVTLKNSVLVVAPNLCCTGAGGFKCTACQGGTLSKPGACSWVQKLVAAGNVELDGLAGAARPCTPSAFEIDGLRRAPTGWLLACRERPLHVLSFRC